MMCWTQVAVLPQPSVAVQVRSMPASPEQPALGAASANVIVTGVAQLSVAVADPVCPGSVGSPHWSWRSGGQVIVGAVVSTNVRCWTQVALLPQPSVAVQVRSMPARPVQLAFVPASANVIVTGAWQLSVAVAEPVWPGSVGSPHWSWRSGGQVIVGAVVSTNVRCWTQVAVLPQP